MGRKFSYIDMMRTSAAKAIYEKRLEKHSEMLKPYKHDGYQEMEHFYPSWNFNWDFIDFNFRHPETDAISVDDNLPADIPNPDGECGGLDCFLYRIHIIYKCNKEDTIRALFYDKFLNVEVISGDVTLIKYNKRKITLIENTQASKSYGVNSNPAYLLIRVQKGVINPYVCECIMKVVLPNNCDECDCVGTTNVSWDTTVTPETIAPGGMITIQVKDGCGPYIWTTSSNGYSLGSNVTDTLSNTLTSAGGVCGTNYDPYATITVTDGCLNTTTYSIRNTGGGTWSNTGTVFCCSTSPCGEDADCSGGDCIIQQYKYAISNCSTPCLNFCTAWVCANCINGTRNYINKQEWGC